MFKCFINPSYIINWYEYYRNYILLCYYNILNIYSICHYGFCRQSGKFTKLRMLHFLKTTRRKSWPGAFGVVKLYQMYLSCTNRSVSNLNHSHAWPLVKCFAFVNHMLKCILRVVLCDNCMSYRVKTCHKNMSEIYRYRSSQWYVI